MSTASGVNNGVLTIQKNGVDVQTFSANQSENTTANITVPPLTTNLSVTEEGVSSLDGTVGKILNDKITSQNTVFANQISEINGNLTGKSSYSIEYYDGTWIKFPTAYGNRVIKTGTGLHVFSCVVNLPNQIPDGQGLVSVSSQLNGCLLITQPFTGKSYPIRITSGHAASWGTIEACNNCVMHGVLT